MQHSFLFHEPQIHHFHWPHQTATLVWFSITLNKVSLMVMILQCWTLIQTFQLTFCPTSLHIIHFFFNFSQKCYKNSRNNFIVLCNPKEENLTPLDNTRQYKGRSAPKGPRRPAKSWTAYSTSRKRPDSANNRNCSDFSSAVQISYKRLSRRLFKLVNLAYPTIYA